jgi:hypothetical protein
MTIRDFCQYSGLELYPTVILGINGNMLVFSDLDLGIG